MIRQCVPNRPRIIKNADLVPPGVFRRFSTQPQLTVRRLVAAPNASRFVAGQKGRTKMFFCQRGEIQATSSTDRIGLFRRAGDLPIAMVKMDVSITRAPATAVKV